MNYNNYTFPNAERLIRTPMFYIVMIIVLYLGKVWIERLNKKYMARFDEH